VPVHRWRPTHSMVGSEPGVMNAQVVPDDGVSVKLSCAKPVAPPDGMASAVDASVVPVVKSCSATITSVPGDPMANTMPSYGLPPCRYMPSPPMPRLARPAGAPLPDVYTKDMDGLPLKSTAASSDADATTPGGVTGTHDGTFMVPFSQLSPYTICASQKRGCCV
jgi:hypothetical protein